MRPCLIAIDMDGTLIGSGGQISDRNRAALLQAEAQGIEIVIATGRRHAYAMRLVRALGLRGASALISSNGTVIRTVGSELVHRRHMSAATALWLCRALGGLRETFVLTYDRVGANGDDTHGALLCEPGNALHNSIGNWMRSNAPYIAHVDNIEHALEAAAEAEAAAPAANLTRTGDPTPALGTLTSHAPIQAMLCGTIEQMEYAEALLRRHPAIAGVGEPEPPSCEIVLHRTAYPDRDLSILDILPAGCSKASALRHLTALRGCTFADVLAIGDNWNDLPMLEAANEAVLMGNAPAELKILAAERGWTVGPTHDEDGVALAIEAVLRRDTALPLETVPGRHTAPETVPA